MRKRWWLLAAVLGTAFCVLAVLADFWAANGAPGRVSLVFSMSLPFWAAKSIPEVCIRLLVAIIPDLEFFIVEYPLPFSNAYSRFTPGLVGWSLSLSILGTFLYAATLRFLPRRSDRFVAIASIAMGLLISWFLIPSMLSSAPAVHRMSLIANAFAAPGLCFLDLANQPKPFPVLLGGHEAPYWIAYSIGLVTFLNAFVYSVVGIIVLRAWAAWRSKKSSGHEVGAAR